MPSHDQAVHVERSIRVVEPKQVTAAGNIPKSIEEFVGRVASGDSTVSIARMKSPSGWVEPPQSPDFDEFTVVLSGELHIESEGKTHVVKAGQAVCVKGGVRVRYSTPGAQGAEYIAVCLPAFSPSAVHRE